MRRRSAGPVLQLGVLKGNRDSRRASSRPAVDRAANIRRALTSAAPVAKSRGRSPQRLQGIAVGGYRLEVDRVAERIDWAEAEEVGREIGRVVGEEAVAQRRRSRALECEDVDH